MWNFEISTYENEDATWCSFLHTANPRCVLVSVSGQSHALLCQKREQLWVCGPFGSLLFSCFPRTNAIARTHPNASTAPHPHTHTQTHFSRLSTQNKKSSSRSFLPSLSASLPSFSTITKGGRRSPRRRTHSHLDPSPQLPPPPCPEPTSVTKVLPLISYPIRVLNRLGFHCGSLESDVRKL